MAAVIAPNLGLYFDRPAIDLDRRALKDGKNFRCKNGRLESLNLGWEKFTTNWVLNGPVLMIDNFFPRNLGEHLLFATATDIYLYDEGTDSVSFLTPIYATGTAAASGTAVTGTGTDWSQIPAIINPGDEIHFGSATQDDPDATWFTVLTVNNDTSITLTASAGTVVDGPYTIRRKFQTATAGFWAFDTFVNDGATGDDLWFATNGTDPVVTWNGSDPTVTLHPELGFICQTLATFSNMMIYGNLQIAGDLFPQDIINSDVGLPLAAGDVGTGLSEQFVAFNGTDSILNMLVLGDTLVIYAERTLVPIQFIGDPLIFLFRVAISGVGPISSNTIADFGDFHEFLGSDAGYMFDGVTLKETNSHVWRDILRQADPARRGKAYAHFDEEQGDLIWSIPGNSDVNVGVSGAQAEIAWTEHYLEDPGPNVEGSPFSKRDFPFTITGFYERLTGLQWDQVMETFEEFNFAWNDQFFQLGFPLNIAGDDTGQIYILNQQQTGDGVALPSFVRFGRFPLRSGRERDLLTRIYPFAIRLTGTLDVTLFLGNSVSTTLTNVGTQSFDLTMPENGHFVTFYRRGRVAEVQFGSSLGTAWVLEGYDYDTKDGGTR